MRRFNPWRQFHGAFVPEWLMRAKGISPGAKLTYARLCRYAGRDGVASPRLPELAEEIAVSKRSVQNYLTELEDAGLIESEQVGLGLPNNYFFLWSAMIDGDDEELPGMADVATPDRQDPATPDRQDPATPSLLEESGLRVSKPAARVAASGRARPRRLKAVAETDDDLASNRLPDEGVEDTPVRRRGPSVGGIAKQFEREARERFQLGDTRRVTNLTALRANISRWHKADGIPLAEIEQACSTFWASGEYTAPGSEPWRRFINLFARMHAKATAPDTSDPAHYTDHDSEQEPIAWTPETWLAAQQ